jgi:hypothetical protein
VWGDEAYSQRTASLKYTGTALLLNDVSIAGWAYCTNGCSVARARKVTSANRSSAARWFAARVFDRLSRGSGALETGIRAASDAALAHLYLCSSGVGAGIERKPEALKCFNHRDTEIFGETEAVTQSISPKFLCLCVSVVNSVVDESQN